MCRKFLQNPTKMLIYKVQLYFNVGIIISLTHTNCNEYFNNQISRVCLYKRFCPSFSAFLRLAESAFTIDSLSFLNLFSLKAEKWMHSMNPGSRTPMIVFYFKRIP